MICDYELVINGKSYKFNSEQALDQFIKENAAVLIDRSMLDVRYSKSAEDIVNDLSKMNAEAYERLSKYRLDKEAYVKELRQSRKNSDEEVIPEYTDGYTSVLKYIQAMSNTHMQEFNRDRYAAEKIREIKSRPDVAILTPEQQNILAAKEVADTFAFWDYTQDIGRALHYIMDQVIHKYENLDINAIRETVKEQMKEEQIPGLTIDGISDEAFNDFIKDIKRVKMGILRKNPTGKPPKLFTEFVIEGETNLEEKLRGKIDLVAVYDDGSVDIYDLKITTRPYDMWDRDKKTATDYQLGFYKRMLEAKGIPSNKITCKIIPVLVSDFTKQSSTTKNSIGKLSLQEMLTVLPDRNESNNINSLINVDKVTVESPIISAVSQKLTKFFPVTMFTEGIQNTSMKSIKDHNVTKNNEGQFVFRDMISGDTITCNTEEELDFQISIYYNNLAEYQREFTYTLTNELANELERLNVNETSFKKGYVSREFRILPAKIGGRVSSARNRQQANNFVDSNLATYRTQAGWKVLKSDDFANMGVIVLINSITHEIDLISLTSNDVFAKVKLPKGDTILGNFYDDTRLEVESDNMVATVGNVELIKLMAILDEMMNDDVFKDYKLNNLRVLNPVAFKGQTQIDLSKITSNYELLNRLNGLSTNQVRTVETFDRVLGLLNEITTYNKSTKFSKLAESIEWTGGGDIATKETKINRLLELVDKLETLYFPKGLSDNDQSIEAFLLRSAYQAIADISGLDMDLFNTEHYSKWGTRDFVAEFKRGTLLNGTDLNTTDTLPIIKPIADKLTAVNRNVRERYTDYKNNDRKHTNKFYDSANGLIANKVANMYTGSFKDLLDTSEFGKRNFIVKDPWKDQSLTNEQREYLKYWLADINKWRYPGEDIEILKADGRYFEIPLLKASWQSKISNGKNFFKASFEDLALDITNPKYANDEDTSVYIKDTQELDRMYNIFKSGDNTDTRLSMLSKGAPEQRFETNLEHVKDMYVFSAIRESEYNTILPQINSAIKALEITTYLTGKPSNEAVEFITDYIKSAILDESLISDNTKGFFQAASILKSTASKAILGFNYVSGLKEVTTGFYNIYSRALVNSIFDKDKVGITDMAKAYSFVWVDALKQVGNITLMEHLNFKYGLANMDINALVERENFERIDSFKFKSHMYWCNRAPDFLHRMTILIGYMVKYGCLDAYSMNGDEVTYDWRKDKRFQHFARGEKNNPAYNDERALYTAMLREFVEKEFKIKDKETGEFRVITMEDELPEAFTQKEADRAVQEANTMFGYMDHDTKSLVYKRGMGTILGQFQTYITAKKNQYFLKRGVYNDGKWVHKKDIDGNLLYFETYTDQNGQEQRRLTTNVTEEPYWAWEGKIMEGILWSLIDMFNVSRPDQLVKAWHDPVKLRNFGYVMSDMLMIALLTWLLLAMTSDEEVYKQPYFNRLAYKVINNTRGDIDPAQTFIGAVDFKFVAMDFYINLGKDFWKVATGSTDVATFLSNNISVLRPSKKELRELLNDEE